MEHQQPRRHRRRLLTPPSRNEPRPGCVRRLLRFAVRHVIRLTPACCTRPRRAPAPTQEPRPLTSEEALEEKKRETERLAREISEDSMSRYSWNRITYNRIPSISRLATSSSSSDSWLQPRNCSEPPIPPPRRCKTKPLKRTAAINQDDVDAAAPSSDVSANPDTCTADQDIDASEIAIAIPDSPESQADDSTAVTSNKMPESEPSCEMSITCVQDTAQSDLVSSDSSIVIANTTACQTPLSGMSETVSQPVNSLGISKNSDTLKDSESPVPKPRKSRKKSMDTAVLSPGTQRKEQVPTDIDTYAQEIVPSSSVQVPTQPTTSLWIDTVSLPTVATMTSASSISGGEQNLNGTEMCEAATQVCITKGVHSIGTMTFTTQVVSSFTTVSTQSSIPLLVNASTQIIILEHKEMLTVIPPVELSNQHIQDHMVANAQQIVSVEPTVPTEPLLVDSIPIHHVETSTCPSIISGEEHNSNGTESCEAATQVSITEDGHSVGTMTYTSQVLSTFRTVSTQSSTPLLVDTCTQIALEPEDMLTLMPTVELSQHIVKLVQNNIVVPTKGQSSYSDAAWIENRVQQLLKDVHHRVQDLTSPISEAQEVQYIENDDQLIDNSSSRSVDASQELLATMIDMDSKNTDDWFVDSRIVLPDFPIQETMPSSELGISNIVNPLDTLIDVDTGVIIEKGGGNVMCDEAYSEDYTASCTVDSTVTEYKRSGTDNIKDEANLPVTNAECTNVEIAVDLVNISVPKQSEVSEVGNVQIQSQPQPVTNSKKPDIMKEYDSVQSVLDEKCATEDSRMDHMEKPGPEHQEVSVVEKLVNNVLKNSLKVVDKNFSDENSQQLIENLKVDGITCSVDNKMSIKSSQEKNMKNCLKDQYQATSSDEEESPHKTSREIFGYVKVNHKRNNSLMLDNIFDQESVQPGCSSQPKNTIQDSDLMDRISVTSSDGKTLNISPKTSQEMFGHINIDGSNQKETSQTSTHANQPGSQKSDVAQHSSHRTKCFKDLDSEAKCAEEDQPKPQNMMQQKEYKSDVHISHKASRERFGHVNIDSLQDNTVVKGKGKKSCKNKNSELEKCLKELREALCSDPRDYEKTRKASRERFGHLNVNCIKAISDEKNQQNGLNDPNKGVHHHHSDISCDEAGPSQSQDGPPNKSNGGKSVKFIDGFELPRTSHYGLNDRETYPLKSVLKRTVRHSPETDNVTPNSTSLSPDESLHLPKSVEEAKTSSATLQTSAPECTSLSDMPGTSSEKDSQPPSDTNSQLQEHPPGECLHESVEARETNSASPQTSAPESASLSVMPGTSYEEDSQPPPDAYSQPQEHPKVIMGHDGFAYPSVVVPILSSDEVEFYEKEDTSVQVLLAIGSYGYCETAKYTRPNGSVIPVAVKLRYSTDDQPALMREGRMSQYLRDTDVFPAFHGYLYLNLDSRLVVGLVSELFGEGKTLSVLLEKHHLSLAARGWVDICIQLAKGLQKIHQIHVIYNDLKSKNILVDVKDTSHPVIKFIDLGLASYKYGIVKKYKPVDVQDADHIAPEIKSANASSKYSDIWALGTLYKEIGDRTHVQGLNEVSKSTLVASPWGRPSLETIIESLEGVADKHF